MAVFLAPAARTIIWTHGFTVMGVACLVNTRACGRLHCFFTGPLYLLGAGATGLVFFEVIGVEWIWILAAMALGTVLAYIPERVRGQYLTTNT